MLEFARREDVDSYVRALYKAKTGKEVPVPLDQTEEKKIAIRQENNAGQNQTQENVDHTKRA